MTYASKIIRLAFFILLLSPCSLAWSAEGKESSSDKVDLDEIKIKLVSKDSISGKKISGPKKQLLKLKMMADADNLKMRPESLGGDNVDLINLGQTEPGDLISNKIK